MLKKTKTLKEIRIIRRKLRRQKKSVSVTSGSFDLLHSGHIKALKEASEQGDVLIVLLNSDQSIRNYKGPSRPLFSERERLVMVSALGCVDYVVVFDELTPNNMVEILKPDVYCIGTDWGRNCVEREIVERYGGRVHVLKLNKEHSTNIIKKIVDNYSKPTVKAVFIDRDGTINVNKGGYIYRIKDFEFAPYVILALKKLSRTNYKVIIITNQSGLGRGYYTKSSVKKLHNWMIRELQKKGIRIDKIYYCPHTNQDNCPCRKPKALMLLQAVQDFGISLNDSWMIGDDEKDILTGREANVKTIKVGRKMTRNAKIQPHYSAENLLEAVNIITD